MAYEFTSTKYLSSTSPVTGYPFTIAGWFSISGAAQNLIIVSKDAGILNNSIGIFANNNRIAGYIYTTGYQEVFATGTYANNTWVHACLVASSATSRTIYRDGGNSTSFNNNLTLPSLGTLSIGFTSVSIVGSAADCAVWNTALTAAEVASLAKGFSASLIQPGNLVYYAPMIRDLTDISGGASITNTGPATVSVNPRIYGL